MESNIFFKKETIGDTTIYRYSDKNSINGRKEVIATNNRLGLSIDFYEYQEGHVSKSHSTSYYIEETTGLKHYGMPNCDVSKESLDLDEETLKAKMEGVYENGVYPFHPPMKVNLPRTDGNLKSSIFIYPSDDKTAFVHLTYSENYSGLPLNIHYQVLEPSEATKLLQNNGISFDIPINQITNVVHAQSYTGIRGFFTKGLNKAHTFLKKFRENEER